MKVIYISKKQFETCHDLGVVEDMFTFERGDLRKSRDFQILQFQKIKNGKGFTVTEFFFVFMIKQLLKIIFFN